MAFWLASSLTSPTSGIITSGIGMVKLDQYCNQLVAIRQELVQWRIERPDHDRIAVHGFEQAGEIRALHREQFREGLPAGLLIARQNHRLHVRDAIGGEEHVL